MHKNGSVVKCISEPIIGPLGFLSRIQGIYLIAILMVAPSGNSIADTRASATGTYCCDRPHSNTMHMGLRA
jgi:hypothetical protein